MYKVPVIVYNLSLVGRYWAVYSSFLILQGIRHRAALLTVGNLLNKGKPRSAGLS
ncbi:hypothetical protein BDV38DRAFT_234301 [Aspergillus pseudotamarii]|uniref:Uncharacterized protein n=1 Tax=Aspergillus pseudotamarii TaxID=132259 RepID=A0A5N6T9C9_ASPPS|nr:uncharacterized protein BDV38DRAFT_234301 [Aspergillus pseudotamarii]KAE8142955.1 hypothetical protein BDV38DRAFT_234301 [Aspergillus pseudotamarii]